MDQFSDLLRQHRVEQNSQLINRLAQENPSIREKTLSLFATVNPKLILGDTREHLDLVADQQKNEVAKIVGVKLPEKTISSSIPKLIVQQERLDWEYEQGQAIPESMSRSELSLYWAPYFKSEAAKELILDLFFEWQSSGDKKILSTDDLEGKVQNDEPCENWEGFGMSLDADPIIEKIKRFLDPLKRRQYTFSYKFSNVQKQHKNPLNFKIIRKILGSLNSKFSGDVIAFPKKFKAPEKKINSSQTEINSKDLPFVFMSLVNQLSNVPENLQWFSGVIPELFVPPGLQSELNRMEEISTLGDFFNFSSQIESSVAALISYNYPTLVNTYSQEKVRDIKKSEALHLPTPSKQDLIEEPVEMEAETTTIVKFIMDNRVAEHFGFESNTTIDCDINYVKKIWSLPDDELVHFFVKDKPVQIEVKMFKKIFHRSALPTESELENRQVLPFRKN